MLMNLRVFFGNLFAILATVIGVGGPPIVMLGFPAAAIGKAIFCVPAALCLILFAAWVLPTENQYQEAKEKKRRDKEEKLRQKDQQATEIQDIKDDIYEQLRYAGDVVELDRLEWPLERAKQVAEQMIHEDARLRLGEFQTGNGDMIQAIWIARHIYS